MKFLNKFLIGFFCLSVLVIFNQSLSYAEQICSGYIPPDRAAADRIKAYINYFTDGEASVIPPDAVEERYYYTIKITKQPSCATLDAEGLSFLPKSIIKNQAALRFEAEQKGISFDERWREYVDEKLKEWAPEFMAEVDKKAAEFKVQLEPALNTLLGITGKADLPAEAPEGSNVVDQKDYDDIISAYIEQIKSGFKPEDMVSLVQDYMVGLKDAVSDFVKTATGEDFNLADNRHSGLLTYWADYSFSTGKSADVANPAVKRLIDIRREIVGDVNTYIFNGQGDVFSSSFGRVLSYFADKALVAKMGIDEIKAEIQEFGEEFNKEKTTILSSVQKLTGEINTPEKEKIAEKFTQLFLNKLFEKFDKEAMDEFEAQNKGKEQYVDKVRYSRDRTAVRESVIAKYVSVLETKDLFDAVVSHEILGKVGQYIDDMIAINNKFQQKFGKSYDTATIAGVDALLGRAFTVDAFMTNYLRTGSSAEDAHNSALSDVLENIDKMTEFPDIKVNAYLEDDAYAVGSDIPSVPITEPYAVGNFDSLFL